MNGDVGLRLTGSAKADRMKLEDGTWNRVLSRSKTIYVDRARADRLLALKINGRSVVEEVPQG